MKITDERAWEIREIASAEKHGRLGTLSMMPDEVLKLLDDREELLRKLGAHEAFKRLLRDAFRALDESA